MKTYILSTFLGFVIECNFESLTRGPWAVFKPSDNDPSNQMVCGRSVTDPCPEHKIAIKKSVQYNGIGFRLIPAKVGIQIISDALNQSNCLILSSI